TSVVPPELPMELSLAVNTSLAALSKYAIYCTEPFRIPFAGRVDICCFDKTGTLTGEDLVVEGVVEPSTRELHKPETINVTTTLVLATAHALVKLDDGEIVGDPMERVSLEAINWKLGANDILTSSSPKDAKTKQHHNVRAVQIKRRFQFS